jgi:hypothetical protein
MRLLEEVRADLGGGDLRRDRHHRHAGALAVEETVDEVQIAWTAAAGADGEPTRDMSVGAGGEGRDLLVAHVQPFDAPASANGVGETVQTVADDAVDTLHSGGGENLDHLVGDRLGHRFLLHVRGSRTLAEMRRSGIERSSPQSLRCFVSAVADEAGMRERVGPSPGSPLPAESRYAVPDLPQRGSPLPRRRGDRIFQMPDVRILVRPSGLPGRRRFWRRRQLPRLVLGARASGGARALLRRRRRKDGRNPANGPRPRAARVGHRQRSWIFAGRAC